MWHFGSWGYSAKVNPGIRISGTSPPGTWVKQGSPVRAGEFSCAPAGMAAVAK